MKVGMKKKLFLLILPLLLSACTVNNNQPSGTVGGDNEPAEGGNKPSFVPDPEFIDTFTKPEEKPTEEEGEGEKEEEEEVIPEPVYEEAPDSLEGVDVNDLSGLYEAFNAVSDNYHAHSISYFNYIGARDYFQYHYHKNYVQEKHEIFTEDAYYIYPVLKEYLEIMNIGYLNKDNNCYSYSLAGETVEERLLSTPNEESMELVKEDCTYQDTMFTLGDINEEYLSQYTFERISSNRYKCENKTMIDEWLPIVAPTLINDGYYMTFSSLVVETNVSEEIPLRIRLYAAKTQRGKIIDSHLDEKEKPNWYLLFSETSITDIDSTELFNNK